MRIYNDNVNFQSKIMFVNDSTFNMSLRTLRKSAKNISYPWTIETMKKGTNLYTCGIRNCIAGCIISDKIAHMFHLATRDKELARQDKVKEFDIQNIEDHLTNSVDFSDKNMHAILIGGLASSCEAVDESSYFNKLKNLIMEKFKLPCTIIGPRLDLPNPGFGEYSVLYDFESDNFIITNSKTETDYYYNFNGSDQNEIEVTDDGIFYNKYEKVTDGLYPRYNKTRVVSGVEDFFNSRFKEIKLSNFDEWG